MRKNLRRAGCVMLALVAWAAWLVGPARVLAAEVAGMVTELRVDRGRVEVKPAGAQEWRKAGPLLALRAGDTVRVTEEAFVVILLSGGRGSVR
ncbi:MAG: hypothetical protein ACREJF_04810, partial [Candidatus Methylomirabilales bacterium]